MVKVSGTDSRPGTLGLDEGVPCWPFAAFAWAWLVPLACVTAWPACWACLAGKPWAGVARGLRVRELPTHILRLDALGRQQEEPVARHEEQRQDYRDDPAITVGDHAPPPSDLGTPVEDVPAVGLKLTVASHLDAVLPWIVPQSEVLV